MQNPKHKNQRLELTGPAKPGKTGGVTGPYTGMARPEAPGQVFRRVWNRTEAFIQSKPGFLVGYLDTLLTLDMGSL